MIVSEHEQVVQKEGPSSQQPDENQDIVKKVNELLARAKKHRKRYDAEWRSNYEFVCNGKQWAMDRPRWRFNEVVNITWSTIMTEIGIQTDARPKFEFTSQEFGDEAFVDILGEVNDRNWEKYKWSGVVQDALFDCKLYHVAHSEVTWDPDLNSGLGDVLFRSLDPYYCYWDPMATDVNKGKSARYFIYAEPMPTSQLKLEYPEFKDKIKPDVNNFMDQKESGGQTSTIYNTFDPFTPTRLPSSASSQGEMYGGEPVTVKVRCWLRDETLEQVCEEKDTGEKEYIEKKKYPTGRYVEIANNVLLRDGPSGCLVKGEWIPYEDDAIPVARLVNYSYAREYCGENEVTHSKGPQKITNYVFSYIMDMFKIQGNPVTLVGAGADVDEESITNEPGNIITAADINQIRREPGTPITQGSFELLSVAQTLFDKVQGLQDVARGVEVPSIGSQVMLEGYLEASQTRPRLKNRNLDQYLQDCGELALRRYLQFYTKPRLFRITNKEGYPEVVEFYVPTDENGQKVAKIRRISTVDGQALVGQQESVEVKGIPDVKVRSGSNLPYAKAQKQQNALAYYNAEAIDREELLKVVDWPNYEEVLQRMMAEEQAQAEAAAAAEKGPSA